MLPQSETTSRGIPPVDWATGDPELGKGSSEIFTMSQATGRPEAQLLLECTRTHVDSVTATRINALLDSEIDWEYVLRTAHEHGVTSLLCQSLNSIHPKAVPEEILVRLRKFAVDNARYNLFRTRELIKLLGILDSEGIPCFPFKGPVLSALVYHNLALREYGDLDVLVHPQNVLRTRDLLIEHGYHVWSPPNQTGKRKQFSHRYKDLALENANGQVRVELHWQLSGNHFRFPLDMEQLWGRLETISLANAKVRTLAIEDLLIYLCMHGSRHGWERLLWICDVAEIVRQHKEIDWQRVRDGAHTLGCERMLGLGLLLARDLLGAKLPEDEWQKVPVDQSVKSLAVQVEALLFNETNSSSGISYWNDLHLRVRERLRDRMRVRLHYYRRYLRLAVVPNERDRAIMPLPRFLSSLYYLFRPFRLVKTFGLTRLKKLRH